MIQKISIFIVGTLLLISSCDIIEGPYINSPGDIAEPEIVVQKVLLEEFTGHQCPMCPAGTAIAKQLDEHFPDRIIIIAYHSGFFARTSTSFPSDYGTTTGDELNAHFEPSSYPSGLINRFGQVVMGSTQWGTATAEQMENEPSLKLTLESSFDTLTRNLAVTATATALKELEELNLCVFITESGLVSPQKTANDPDYPNGTIPDYIHNHVFRASLNGTWGNVIFSEGAAEGVSQTVPVIGTIDSDWNEEKMSIVCFVYDSETGEVVQAETIELF